MDIDDHSRNKSRCMIFYFLLISFFASAQTNAGNDQGSAAPTANGQKTQEATPVFKANTRVVLVPVVVNDKKNKHISGLTKDDFTIYENGKRQHIVSCEEVDANNTAVEHLKTTQWTPPTEGFDTKKPIKVFTNEIAGVNTHKRLVIILLDSINTNFGDQQYTKDAIVKYLATYVKEDSLVEILTLGPQGIKIIHDFSQDTGKLIAALKKSATDRSNEEKTASDPMNPAPALGEQAGMTMSSSEMSVTLDMALQAQQANIDRLEGTMRAFKQIALAFTVVPGRKSLIWVTGGIPFKYADPYSAFGGTIDAEKYQRMLQLMNDANINIYPVDARGLLVVGVPDATTGYKGRASIQSSISNQRAQIDAVKDTQGMMADIADMTGGRAFYNTNDITGALDRASQDSKSYYELTYALAAEDMKPGWRRLKVEVNRQNINLRARKGFLITDQANVLRQLKEWEITAGLFSPFEFTAITVRVAFTGTKPFSADKQEIGYRLILPSTSITVDTEDKNHLNLDFAYIVTDLQGNVVDRNGIVYEMRLKPESVDTIIHQGVLFDGSLKVPPGEYNVHFVVRDNIGGRTGGVHAPLSVK